MKLTLSTSALAAILGLALASVPVTVQAQTPATTVPAPAPAAAPAKTSKSKPIEYTGNVTAIDTTANTVTVANTTKLLVLIIAPKTIIEKNKKKATLADFAIGDSVTGSYTKDATTGTLTAHSLRKKTATTPKAAKTAPAPVTSATPAAAPAPAAPSGQ